MTRRVDTRKPPRAFYRFPWSDRAREYAVWLATLHEDAVACGPSAKPMSYRHIAEELVAQGLVQHKPDAATVARMLLPELAKRRALAELAKGAA